MRRVVDVGWADRTDKGSCNGCTENLGKVFVIKLMEIEVRLCVECVRVLRRDMKELA